MRTVGFFHVLLEPYSRVIPVLVGCWVLAAVPVRAAEELRGSPAVHILPGEFASEHWDFTARFDSGHLLFVEFIVTNIGLGDHNAVVFGHLVSPDGTTKRFTNGRTEKNWTLSADRLRMEIGNSLLDMHSPEYAIRVTKRSVRLELQIRPDTHPLWTQSFTPPGYALDLLAVAAPIEGTLWLKGMAAPLRVRGYVAVTHSWTNSAGSALVHRRVEFFSLHADTPIYSVDLTAPDGTQRRWIVTRRPDQTCYRSEHFALTFHGQLSGQHEDGYAVPSEVQLNNDEIAGTVRLEWPVLQADPFIDLLRPVRYLVSLALDLRPRRIWAQSQIELAWHAASQVGSPPQRGTAITAVTFLNPWPTTSPKARQLMFQR